MDPKLFLFLVKQEQHFVSGVLVKQEQHFVSGVQNIQQDFTFP